MINHYLTFSLSFKKIKILSDIQECRTLVGHLGLPKCPEKNLSYVYIMKV